MSNNKIILSVPWDLKYTSTVENFVEVILPIFNPGDTTISGQELRSTLNEAFVNVIRHSPNKSDELVEIIFEVDIPRLFIRFPDQGNGIKVEGYLPPYPDNLVGNEYPLLQTIDGSVLGQVKDRNTLYLRFSESDLDQVDPVLLLENIKAGGMGLSLIVKLMDRVRFVFSENEGNCLEIMKSFAE